MQNNIIGYISKIPWQFIFLAGLLLIMELSVHPLTFGPDRWIHDPGVYRLNNANYLISDSYTEMAVRSRVYIFYAKVIHVGELFQIHEERWRQLLYIACLVILYYSIIQIGKIFSKNLFVIPLLVSLHAFIMIFAPPFWMYGPFIQVDGGLAPRSIGIALSFLSFYFLLQNAQIIPWILLGVATFIHVSNSLIVFTLFLASWLLSEIIHRKELGKDFFGNLVRKAIMVSSVYIFSGGWFAFYVASIDSKLKSFSDGQFIWAWIYFRAPYMALSEVPEKFWVVFFIHVVAMAVGWYMLRRVKEIQNKKLIDLLGLVGLGSVMYLFLFYFFSVIWPWLPGFQFYSIRVIYFFYFVTYLFVSLCVVLYYQSFFKPLILVFIEKKARFVKQWAYLLLLVCLIMVGLRFFFLLGKELVRRGPNNLHVSWERFCDIETRPTQVASIKYLYSNPQPFLSPVAGWSLPPGSIYLPSVVTVKSFGFTKSGLEEWFNRLNTLSDGSLLQVYEEQVSGGKFKPVVFDWNSIYRNLSAEKIRMLAEKYHFRLFLTYQDMSYPFPIVVEDKNYRLYQVAE